MRYALGSIYNLTDDVLVFAKQLGAKDVIVHSPVLPGPSTLGVNCYEFRPLLMLRTRVESAGLKIEAIENIPREWYYKIMLGLPGRDEQIENFCKTLRNMGKAGIPILGYNFCPGGVWRTSDYTLWRGGARVTSFDYELVKNAPLTEYGIVTEEKMWENFAYFIERVMPVAEEANVKMALHPDDPPVPSVAGISRIMRSVEAFKRAMEIFPSEYNGIEFCQGTFSEMGCNVIEAIEYFGSRKKIFYVHFRNVIGNPYKFHETFVDDGQTDMLEAMLTYKRVGFEGCIIDDHVPVGIDDSPWGHRMRAYAAGYIQALIKAVNSLS
ncbi:mannonate dehydratase [Candidatus Bathyarchaeota archaeon]|nr:mannonate dehydratase [Candidatus Bathyarchaeota archaeon]